MGITVYTTGPACHKCNLTKAQLSKAGITFREVLLSDVPEKAEEFKARGWTTAPIVVTPDDSWFDFRIDKIRELKKQAQIAA